MATGVKFFNPAKKGEIYEMQKELESNKVDRQKVALKSIIAAMTIGKDVSMLFPNVVKCIHASDLDLKKLVYLFVMNYAKSHPTLAILAVNQFVKDAANPNPLIRALAIRTMGCIRIEQIVEYLYIPLKQCLKDADPYVRKTAAICVAKIFDISPEPVRQQGFVDILIALLGDSNPMVVSNSLAALCEINEACNGEVFQLTPIILNKLLAALNECTEWGQTVILNAVSTYEPKDSREAESIAERVTSRLQHSNSAVVLGAIRLLMSFMDHIQSQEVIRTLNRKMAAPLVTLLSKEPEIQYVALRNISLILQKRPNILQYEMKVFFCKYKDPIYVKMEKLELMIMLASEKNIDQVLLEFKEYATAADVDFVRKAVRAIGRCAIKLENAAERCIHVLLDLIDNDFDPVIQESIIVIKDIFRKYPNRYESIIGRLCKNLNNLDEAEARSAMIWIIGEYADRIGNAPDLLHGFLSNFMDEPMQVQLQLLTATVKLFLKRPKASSKKMVVDVLELATNESDNPDVRDRGIIYWRLLSDSKAAKAVVLAEKPLIKDDTTTLDPSILEDLVAQISSLSSVYHKPADAFVRSRKPGVHLKNIKEKLAKKQAGDLPPVEPLPPIDGGLPGAVPVAAAAPAQVADLLSGITSPEPTPAPAAAAANQAPDATTEKKILLPAERGDGMHISGNFSCTNGAVSLHMDISNQSNQVLQGFAVQFNVNVFNLAPAAPMQVAPIAPGQSSSVVLPLTMNGPACNNTSPFLQIALKNSVKIYYFQDVLPFKLLFAANGLLEKRQYVEMWKSLPDANETKVEIQNLRSANVAAVQQHLTSNHVFFIAGRNHEDKQILYHSLSFQGTAVLIELSLRAGVNNCTCCVRTNNAAVVPRVLQVLRALLVAS
mmetsp:Transcript_17123/g.66679  ORF Transcript_17123/g.66679 Transcript_17123/m.66679 type:complete len:889 (+) Transcript_17123:127-2793(+)|eukprot:CAMPEP_0114612740 /NCGR_PEP_ID=MMETSP0168-20121206/4775_1 /TAXON_ID=95228 ORGANISM="Vannella sp., Strain DIVA3 517/6/12" /NCGR_SAMPLE_ID=MMETSP0168 /ASSEMBLY_ACC=CAM_ASM_000044 /LENGTH=888 /DNA_ID=CAMNT_0001823729 /DNA_START=77 /DNA_END=2743 /DNA_ORIENTATION=-